MQTEAQLPSDRHTVDTGNRQQPFNSVTLNQGAVGGDWLIIEVLGKQATGQETPYLKFDTESHNLYGSNGCNTLNATYKNNPADSTLSFDNMITTMRACPGEDISEAAINGAVASTARYSWAHKDGRYYLYLKDSAGKVLMTLMRQSFDFLNGAWKVKSIEGVAVNNDEMQLVFDMAEMKLHGNTGCNVLNGSIVTDMAVQGSISFQNMATTRMTCPDINLETTLLVALEAAAQVKPVNKNTVELLNAHGGVVLTLVR